jgi:hypothetical protein
MRTSTHRGPSTACRSTLVLWASLAVLLAAPRAHAQLEYEPDAVKAAYLYRFAAYVQWPSEAMAQSNFTIAILCGEQIAEQLRPVVAGHVINGLPAQVRQLRRLSEVDGAQMLYVGPSCSRELAVSLSALAARPILIVTDAEGGLQDGATINFISVSQHIRFEVSLAPAQRSGLKISSELLSVAARVLGGNRIHSRTGCPPMSSLEGDALQCPQRLATQ